MECKGRKVTGVIEPREANEFKFKHCYGGSWTNYQPSPKNHESRKDVKLLGLIYTNLEKNIEQECNQSFQNTKLQNCYLVHLYARSDPCNFFFWISTLVEAAGFSLNNSCLN